MKVYYACKYAPAELMAGFGETAERLDPSPAAFICSESCTHPNMCSFAKAVIEKVHGERVKRLILTDCCDAMRRTYDALKASEEMEFLWLLPLPHKTGKPEVRLFREELKKLAAGYERFCGRKFDADLAEKAYRKQKEAEKEPPQGTYIAVAGAHGGGKLLRLAEEVFPEVPVADATCSGNRRLGRASKEGSGSSEERISGFFDWYAEALLKQENPCMRMWNREVPAEISAENPPAGTVFHTIKFCDYYGFEYMSMGKDRPGRMLKVETDTTGSTSGQMKTRLEAFREELEMAGLLDRNPAGVSEKKRRGPADFRGTSDERKEGRPAKEQAMGTNDQKKAAGTFYVAGIDSGSASTDAVIMNSDRQILGRAVLATAAGAEGSSEAALKSALDQAGIRREDLAAVVTTGYGRASISASDQAVTEITCHAKGAHFLNPEARTVIDIGGQDSKVIRIDPDGKVRNFVMNDKCAAGTGRFLEMQARTMGLDMEEMGRAGLDWKKDLTITSMCTVFAESEVVSLIAANTPPADIIHGLNKAIARRTAALVSRVGGEPPYIMTGGVAGNKGVVKCLEEELGAKIFVSEDAQICGAIGACLAALRP